jgi:DNA (cytosine-5)-methyltransferase 1
MSAPSLGQAVEIAKGVLPREFDSWEELPASWQPGDTTGQWGQYAAAIHRWETLTRPAPPPTELSAKGTPRLSAKFSEWMMGLPDGWITDVPGITRNEALKAAGNGVVPQQAAAALRIMLDASEAAA